MTDNYNKAAEYTKIKEQIAALRDNLDAAEYCLSNLEHQFKSPPHVPHPPTFTWGTAIKDGAFKMMIAADTLCEIVDCYGDDTNPEGDAS